MLVTIAVVLRIAFFVQARPTPLVEMHKWDQTDMNYYDWWAKQILAGDYLSRNVPGPFNFWHQTIADKWFEQNPAIKEELTRQAQPMNTDAQHLLWKQWLGDKTFYQEPAYSYLMALTYAVFGPHPQWVFGWQMLLGVWAVVLAFRLAERHFDAVAATFAGLLTALGAVELMHELTLLRDAPLAFLTLLLLDLTDRALAEQNWWRWLLLGVTLGLALLVKSVFLPFLPLLFLLLVWKAWKNWRKIALSTAALAAGMLLAFSPAILRNLAVGVSPLTFSGRNAGLSFICNNLPDFDWEAPNPLNEKLVPRLMGESEGNLLSGMWLTLKTHDTFWSFARIPLLKFDEIWHWWERPDNVSFYHYQLFAPILKYLPTFFWVAPLGLVGLVMSFRRFPNHLTLYSLLAVMILPMVLMSVMMRYRLPVVAITTLFAGFCLAWLLRQALGRQWVWFGLGLVGVILVCLWTGRPLSSDISLIRRCDCVGTFEGLYRESCFQAAQQQDYLRAAEIMEDFLRYEPAMVRIPVGQIPANMQDATTLDFYREVHRHCASLYNTAHRPQQAAAHARRVEEINQILQDYVRINRLDTGGK